MPDPEVTVRALDHVVLNVADAERSVRWYHDKLGLEPVRYDEWRAGAAPFVSLRISDSTIIDLFETERDGENMDHLALWVDGDLDALAADPDLDVIGSADELFGAQGVGAGIYLRDPDGNRVEIRRYPPG